MGYLKAAIIFIFIVLIMLVGTMMTLHDSEYVINKAFEEYLRGNNLLAEKLIDKSKDELSPTQYHLYKAYVARGKNLFDESNKQLNLAAQSIKKNNEHQAILTEIYLNLAVNNYLINNSAGMKASLAKAKENGIDQSDWYNFLVGVQEYREGNYEKALDLWDKSTVKSPLSSWMKHSFDNIFNEYWLTIHRAKAEIFLGNYVQARQTLEKELAHAAQNQLDEINFLLGLTYLKEADDKPLEASTSYYKLAFGYFNKVPLSNEKYLKDRQYVMEQISHQFAKLVDAGKYQELSFYTNQLEKWHANSELAKFTSKLEAQLNSALANRKWQEAKEITNLLNRIVIDPAKRKQLAELFHKQLLATIASNQPLDHLEKLWEGARLLSDNQDEIQRNLGNELAKEIISRLPTDDINVSQTASYLEFWRNLIKDPNERSKMAEELESLALKDDSNKHPEKAVNIIKLAFTLLSVQQQESFKALLADHLKVAYEAALKQNNLNLLQSIVKIQSAFGITQMAPQEKEDLHKSSLEMLDLYEHQHYEKAREKALFVLEMDPQNMLAHKIAGLSNYHLGAYSQALANFKALNSTDEAIGEAMAVSEIITGDPSQGTSLLKKINANGNIDPSIYLRLGYALLSRSQPKESLEWFSKLPAGNPEAIAGMAYAFHSLGDWKKSLGYYFQLPPNFKDLNGMKSIAIESLLSLGHTPEAEAVLKRILIQRKINQLNNFSSAFKTFKEGVLDNLSSDYIAGVYYKNVLGDLSKALEFFQKSKPPSPLISVEIGEIMQARGKKKEARELFNKALEASKGTSTEAQVKKRVLPALALFDAEEGFFPESIQKYQDYFSLLPGELAHRIEFAKALEQVRRYDLALEQYKILDQGKKLDEEGWVAMINAMEHLGQFAEARRLVMIKLNGTPPLKLANQIALVEIMTVNPEDELYRKILKELPPAKERDFETNQALLSLWIEQGNYKDAVELSNSMKTELEKTQKGLLLLAKLFERLSKSNEAVEYLSQAHKKGTEDNIPHGFLEPYHEDVKNLKQLAAETEKKIESDPDNLTLKLNLAHQLIDIAVETHVNQPDIEITDMSELRKANIQLKKLAEVYKNIPGVYFLLGVSYFLQQDNTQALNAFQEAIKLDPSYVDAYKYMSMVYSDMDQNTKAMDALTNALRYAPHDAEAWQDLAQLYHKTGNELDSIDAWKNAILLRPAEVEYYINMAEVKKSVNNPEDAKLILEKAALLAPKNSRVLQALLSVLYDPGLVVDDSKKEDLQKEQNAIYKALHAIDPKSAEEIKSKNSK